MYRTCRFCSLKGSGRVIAPCFWLQENGKNLPLVRCIVSQSSTETGITRRDLLGAVGKAATTAAAAPAIHTVTLSCAQAAEEVPLKAVAGVDRATVLPGKTYLRAWA